MYNDDDERLMQEKTGDDTTILDSSTVPTYEEFTRKKMNRNLFNKIPYLNSTQYNEPSSLMTDDESDDEEKHFKQQKQKLQQQLQQKLHQFREPLRSTDKLCSALDKINLQSHSPNLNSIKFKLIKSDNKTPKIIESPEELYITVVNKMVQTSFTEVKTSTTDGKSGSDENLNLYLSVVSNQNEESSTSIVDFISETISESPPVEKSTENAIKKSNLLTTPLRITESASICPKSLTKPSEDQSPKLIRLSESPNIVTTYEKVKIKQKNVLIINNKLDKHHEVKPKCRKRVSMCAEDLPPEIVEHNLDDDENRLDVTRGNIVILDSIHENDKGKLEKRILFFFF
jgi:hypothetical protein